MKTTPALLACLATSTLWLPLASAETPVTVHVRIDASLTAPFDEPAFVATCDVAIPAASNGSVVLDAAACVDAWTFVEFPCCGRFVTSITGPGETDPTDQRNMDSPCPGAVGYWSLFLGGASATVGIDGYAAADGDAFEFDYFIDEGCTFALTIASFFTNADPDSPVPIRGVL